MKGVHLRSLSHHDSHGCKEVDGICLSLIKHRGQKLEGRRYRASLEYIMSVGSQTVVNSVPWLIQLPMVSM